MWPTVLSIVLGGVLAYGIGVPWYMLLSKPWMAAAKMTEADVANTSPMPYIAAVVAWLVAATVLNGHIFPLLGEDVGLVKLLRFTVGLWISFGLLSTVLSTMFGNRGRNLLWIDGGYTLIGGLIIAVVHHFIV